MLDEDESPLDGPAPTPAEQTASFAADVATHAGGPAGLAATMQARGDLRSREVIVRGIQRIASGDTKVSGEMRVILNQVRQEHLRFGRLMTEATWVERADGSIAADVADFSIAIYPATKGRWRSTLVHKGGYSPSWPTWQHTVEDAKRAAIRRLLGAEMELDEVWAYDNLPHS